MARPDGGAVDQLLKCPICLDRFTTPRMLPCQHSFCEGCLGGLQKMFGNVTCPVCRQAHQIPGRKLSNFPTNLVITQLLDITPAAPPGQRSGGTRKDEESLTVDVPDKKYKDKEIPKLTIGGRGKRNSEFEWPRGVCVSQQNEILVADSENRRVHIFNNSGRFVKGFQCSLRDDTNDTGIVGVAQTNTGNVLVTDRLNHRVIVFNREGIFKLQFGRYGQGDGEFNCPWGIATDNIGLIYVCDRDNNRIQVFQTDGTFLRKFGVRGKQTGQFQGPHFLTLSPDGRIYVSDTDNHRIQVFSKGGTFLFTFGTEQIIKYPKGIVIDAQGFVIVADNGNSRIQVFRGDGLVFCVFGEYGSNPGQMKGIEGIGLLSNGLIVASDRENHRIHIF